MKTVRKLPENCEVLGLT